ncbi:MAG: lipopolysaccharide assembly protein LapA domain-containing protein [Candidatus Aminicenantaceae bacterium]
MKPKFVIIIVLTLLALIIAFQNKEIVTFQLFFWTISMSRILVIIGFLFIGFLLGLLAGYRSRNPKS